MLRPPGWVTWAKFGEYAQPGRKFAENRGGVLAGVAFRSPKKPEDRVAIVGCTVIKCRYVWEHVRTCVKMSVRKMRESGRSGERARPGSGGNGSLEAAGRVSGGCPSGVAPSREGVACGKRGAQRGCHCPDRPVYRADADAHPAEAGVCGRAGSRPGRHREADSCVCVERIWPERKEAGRQRSDGFGRLLEHPFDHCKRMSLGSYPAPAQEPRGDG